MKLDLVTVWNSERYSIYLQQLRSLWGYVIDFKMLNTASWTPPQGHFSRSLTLYSLYRDRLLLTVNIPKCLARDGVGKDNFFLKHPEPTNYCKLGTLSSSTRSESPFQVSQAAVQSDSQSAVRESLRRRENFLRLKQEGRKRVSSPRRLTWPRVAYSEPNRWRNRQCWEDAAFFGGFSDTAEVCV